MSSCGYYNCFKGKPTCRHPSNGDIYTKALRQGGSSRNQCDFCRKTCNGIYPSQLPTVALKNKVEVMDKNGNCIYNKNGETK